LVYDEVEVLIKSDNVADKLKLADLIDELYLLLDQYNLLDKSDALVGFYQRRIEVLSRES